MRWALVTSAMLAAVLACGHGAEPRAPVTRPIGPKELPRFRVVNAHEHLQSAAVAPRR